MFGGQYNQNGPGGGPGGLFAHLAAGLGGGGYGHGAPPRAYDEYFKAYSMAMLSSRERANVSYGGKIILPPSALARLTQLEIESPWLFSLKNPANPAASTHAGVLEFIAEEGVAHLPYWMMKTLRLKEGDPIRITGATLPKGKRVKLQPQTVDFLELADPKAVLEQALRNFSTLTQGDIVEINHNTITFPILIMEILPPGPGIAIVDTDLEVDFAAPKGYVEPERPAPAPVPTMASKLKIDLNASTPGSSRPGSAMGGTTGTGAATGWEHFKGRGETLAGRKTKGKGVSVKKAEEVAEGSKINRTDRHRVIHTDDLDRPTSAPAPLNLPFGQLFFGYNYVPYKPPATTNATADPSSVPSGSTSPTFGGHGNTLSGRAPAPSKGKGKEKEAEKSASGEHGWGKGGQTLSGLSAGAAALAPKARTTSASAVKQPPPRSKSPEIDWDYYDDSMDQDDDDAIDIDSD
ncbi:UFD1-domain-containing protein [Auricularia subglabra TFB-10046 SS5]|nr:UFD1-domain-containing protein [Auricularia subglabra TFB-10046 SS5]